MENVKLYLIEEDNEIKATVIANNINEAMSHFQGFVENKNQDEEFSQGLHLIQGSGRADWQIEVYENYKPAGLTGVLTKDMISIVYDVFEFDFVMGRVYGTI